MSAFAPRPSGVLTRSEVVALVAGAVADYVRESLGSVVAADESTRLSGNAGLFDSMGLVTVVLEVEQRVNDRAGTALTLADDRAMAQERSPFRTVGSLAEYVTALLAEQGPVAD